MMATITLGASPVEEAQLKLIDLVDEAERVCRRYYQDWLTDDEKALREKASIIQNSISRAINLAENAVGPVEVEWPAPYQVLVDELRPLQKREDIEKRFKRVVRWLSNNPWGRNSQPWEVIMSPDLAKEVEASWKANGGSQASDRIWIIRENMRNKMRQGSKALAAKLEAESRRDSARGRAGAEARRQIHADNPGWATILEEANDLDHTVSNRQNAAVRKFRKPIKEALENLQSALGGDSA
jgi:hypothetical protein